MFDQRQPDSVISQAKADDTPNRARPFAWVVTLNGLDHRLIRQRSEVIYPVILLGLVLLNGSVAFGAFFIASGVFFPALATGQRIFAGALIGLIVGFVDWMIIAWHPSLPRWFVAGLHRPSLQPARSLGLAIPVAGLALLGFWAWAPDLTWPQQTFLSLLLGVLAGATHLVLLWRRQDSTPTVDEQGYPQMPDFLERLLPFMVRLLLTALLSVVIGTGLSVAMNTDAVELARTAAAADAATTTKEAARQREQQVLDDEYEAALEEVTNYEANIAQWSALNQELTSIIAERTTALAAAQVAFDNAGNKVRCERGEQVPGMGECTGRAGDRGHTAAVQAEEEARAALNTAREELQTAQSEQATHTSQKPVPPTAPARGIATAQPITEADVAEHRAGMMGLAATLRSLEKAAEMQAWPWWVRWGPEGVIFIVDIIPVLLKLLLGFQEVERRMWRRDADEVYDSLNERRLSLSVAAATTGVAQHQNQALEEVARIRRESDVRVAELDRDTDLAIAGRVAANRASIAELGEEKLREVSMQRLAAAFSAPHNPSEIAAEAPVEAPTEPSVEPSVEPTTERPRPTAPDTPEPTDLVPHAKYTWFAEPYVMGPRLSDEGVDSANAVHLAVRLPLDQEVGNTISTVSSLIAKCVVAKSRGAQVTPAEWEEILANYRDPLGVVNRQGLYQVSDGHLINRYYQPRGDLRQYLRQLESERLNIPYRQVVEWMSELAEQVSRLHHSGWLHNDLKPANILATGDMTLGKKLLTGARFGSLILTDFDLACESSTASQRQIPLTASYAAPESLEPTSPSTYHIGSREADIFGLGTSLLYLLTGRAVNHLVQEYAPDAQPGHDGWRHAYAEVISQAISDRVAVTPVPTPVTRLLTSMIDADPQARPQIDDVRLQLEDLRHSIPAGEYPAPYDPSARQPQGISPDLINLFNQLGYRLDLDPKDFS